jgi:hypothetical protein
MTKFPEWREFAARDGLYMVQKCHRATAPGYVDVATQGRYLRRGIYELNK